MLQNLCFPSPTQCPKVQNVQTLVFHECETSFSTPRDENRMMELENKVPREMFGHKEEGRRSWKQLHNKEHHNLYPSPYTTPT